jgi:hypothetical protein
MTIQADVRGIAQSFNLDAALVQAIVNAEGNIVAAVRCTYPHVTTREEAIRILCRSIVHSMRDYIVEQQRLAGDFVAFFSRRWAPINVANDPHHLNENWPNNVRQLWGVA